MTKVHIRTMSTSLYVLVTGIISRLNSRKLWSTSKKTDTCLVVYDQHSRRTSSFRDICFGNKTAIASVYQDSLACQLKHSKIAEWWAKLYMTALKRIRSHSHNMYIQEMQYESYKQNPAEKEKRKPYSSVSYNNQEGLQERLWFGWRASLSIPRWDQIEHQYPQTGLLLYHLPRLVP